MSVYGRTIKGVKLFVRRRSPDRAGYLYLNSRIAFKITSTPLNWWAVADEPAFHDDCRAAEVVVKIRLMKADLLDIFKLDRSEKIQLLEDLWDSIAADPAAVPVSEWQKQELRRRKVRFLKNPTAGVTWGQAKRKIRKAHG